MVAAVLEVQDLYFAYDNNRKILDGISFSIGRVK